MSTPVNTVTRLVPGLIEQTAGKPQGAPGVGNEVVDKGSFSDLLSNLVTNVNDLQVQSGTAQQALVNGDPVELHEVMIKLEQAGIAMDLLLEIRNRLLNGFTELMRMPM
jgi:flagellar hook-basal body complex protein FliE